MHRTEGLASAQRLCPHGMPMPYFRWTRLGQGPARTCKNRDQKRNEMETRLLDIMAGNSIYYRRLYIVIDKQ